MTLKEWEEMYSVKTITQRNGTKNITDASIPTSARWSLWHLSDYVVTSVSAGVVWLNTRLIPIEERVTLK